MTEIPVKQAINLLSGYLSDRRRKLIDKVLAQRTRHITIVLEDVFQPQNASAVLRTCECQGIQDIHIVEKDHQYEVNPKVVKGASKWLTIHRHQGENSIADCYRYLKKHGYSIAAVDPSPGAMSIHELEINQKTALVFGTEYAGLSSYAKEHADLQVHIPMFGFTESYNLSVSAATCMQTIVSKMRTSSINFSLSENELDALKLSWYKGHVKAADEMLSRLKR